MYYKDLYKHVKIILCNINSSFDLSEIKRIVHRINCILFIGNDENTTQIAKTTV